MSKRLTKEQLRDKLAALGIETTGKETKADLERMLAKATQPTMAALREARKRYRAERVGGKLRIDNGDPIADLLRPLTPMQVALAADKLLDEPDGTHAEKYAHLNPGQVRMNSGNRIRGAVKRGAATIDDVATVVEAALSMAEDAA